MVKTTTKLAEACATTRARLLGLMMSTLTHAHITQNDARVGNLLKTLAPQKELFRALILHPMQVPVAPGPYHDHSFSLQALWEQPYRVSISDHGVAATHLKCSA
jgi:hypothetical protein